MKKGLKKEKEAEAVAFSDEPENVTETVEDLEVAEPEIIEEESLPLFDEGEDFADLPQPPSRALVASDLGRADPLQQYLGEIGKHKVLTAEEEENLTTRYKNLGDVEAAYKLVVSNLRLVVKIAYEFRRNIHNLLDLIQEGNIGLMRAVEKYDPDRGVRLSSYAAWWIRAYMIRHILNNWSLVKIGTTQNQRRLFFNLKKEKEALEAQGFRAEPKLLASRLGVREQEVVEMQMRMSGSDVSLDAPLGEEDGASRIDFLEDEGPSSFAQVEDSEFNMVLREKMMRFREGLSERDRMIFDERLLTEDPVTLREIGERLGVSRERVRQIENDIKEKLKEFMQAFPEIEDVVTDEP